MKTGICLTVKNEAPYLAEWIVYIIVWVLIIFGFMTIISQDKIVEACVLLKIEWNASTGRKALHSLRM